MKPVSRVITTDGGMRIYLPARLGTVCYRFFDNDREFEGGFYWVEPLLAVESLPLDPIYPVNAANDAS